MSGLDPKIFESTRIKILSKAMRTRVLKVYILYTFFGLFILGYSITTGDAEILYAKISGAGLIKTASWFVFLFVCGYFSYISGFVVTTATGLDNGKAFGYLTLTATLGYLLKIASL